MKLEVSVTECGLWPGDLKSLYAGLNSCSTLVFAVCE